MPEKLTEEQLQALAVRFGLETAVLQSLAETASETDAFLPDGRASLFFEGHLFYRNLEKAGISPDTCRAVIEKTRELDMVSIPGALTPTEIADAHRYGADFVKLFPVSAYPPDYIKAVRAPLSHVRLLAVGGVNISNMEVYREAGVLGFGLGHTNILRGLPEGASEAAFVELVSRYVSTAKGTEK